MKPNDEMVQDAIAAQASEWFVTNDDGPLGARDEEALADWLRASPVHVEKFLGVSIVARDLRKAVTDRAYSVESCIALARSEDDSPVSPLRASFAAPVWGRSRRRWLTTAVATAACAVLSLALYWSLSTRPAAPLPASAVATVLQFETRHGEQLSHHLEDGSVLHLNTDSAVTVRYDKAQRLVMLTSGQANFEVAHEADRAFRVLAGSAEVIAIGTKFDVRLERGSTVVTVAEGRVAVGPATTSDELGAQSGALHSPRFVQLSANQQISVAEGRWPATPTAVDSGNATAWLHRQIVFEQEPLERVAAEFNRYAPKPIEIATPALRNLAISGAFATDDPEAFVAFLRSLTGVRIEVTATRIRVFRDASDPAKSF